MRHCVKKYNVIAIKVPLISCAQSGRLSRSTVRNCMGAHFAWSRVASSTRSLMNWISVQELTPISVPAFGLRGITSRVQWWKDYQTFTVRIERPNGALTEYTKRLTTIKRVNEGFLYPYWTIQAYLDSLVGRCSRWQWRKR